MLKLKSVKSDYWHGLKVTGKHLAVLWANGYMVGNLFRKMAVSYRM